MMKLSTKLILMVGLVGSLSLGKPAHAAQSPPEDPIVEAHIREEGIDTTNRVSEWNCDRTRNKLS